MKTSQLAGSRVGWRVLAATPAMIGSLLLVVFLSGGIAPWGPVPTLIWRCIGVVTLTPVGEAPAARPVRVLRTTANGDRARAETGARPTDRLRPSPVVEPSGAFALQLRCYRGFIASGASAPTRHTRYKTSSTFKI